MARGWNMLSARAPRYLMAALLVVAAALLLMWALKPCRREGWGNKSDIKSDDRKKIVKYCVDNLNPEGRGNNDRVWEKFQRQYPEYTKEAIYEACIEGFNKAKEQTLARVGADENDLRTKDELREKCASKKLCETRLGLSRPCAHKTKRGYCCEFNGKRCTTSDYNKDINKDVEEGVSAEDLRNLKITTELTGGAGECRYTTQVRIGDSSSDKWKCPRLFPVKTGLNWNQGKGRWEAHQCTSTTRCKQFAIDKSGPAAANADTPVGAAI